MNKLRTLLTWGLLAAVTHVMGYTITVDPIQIQAGQSTSLIINLNNTETNLTAYQMSLYLPEGVTVQKKANGKYAYTVNADRQDPDLFTTTVKDAADGSILIAVFSADKDVLAGTSGELIRLPIEVASTVTTSLQGSIKDIEFTDVNAQAHKISDVNFTMTLDGGSTPVTGITLSQTSLSLSPGSSQTLTVTIQPTNATNKSVTWSSSNTSIATVDQNGKVTAKASGSCTITCAAQDGSGVKATCAVTVVQPVTDDVTVGVPDITITAGGSSNLIINMQTELTNLTAYQMSLYLPQGVTVKKKSNGKYDCTFNGDRQDADFFNTSIKDAADGSLLITCYSDPKSAITGTSGELIRLSVEVASSVTSSLQGSIRNIEFTDLNTQPHNISDVNFTMKISGGASPAIIEDLSELSNNKQYLIHTRDKIRGTLGVIDNHLASNNPTATGPWVCRPVVLDESNPLITSVSQLSSPYTEPTEGSLDAMIDGNAGTFWHSTWSNGDVENGQHYFQVEMLDQADIDVAFKVTRRKTDDNHITEWVIYGTNNANATKANCTKLAVIETPYNYWGETRVSDIFKTGGYKYLRFYIYNTTTGGGFGHLAEFQLYPATYDENRDASPFAIIQKNGGYYLYSVRDKAFITPWNDGDESTNPLLPNDNKMNIYNHDDHFVFDFIDTGYTINVNEKGVVINDYGTLTDKFDEGNLFTIEEVGDFDPTEALAMFEGNSEGNEAIIFADANVKALCVANWDTNGDGELSKAEAAAVTSLGTVFYGNKEISSFNELQYFTGLTSIGEEAFRNCSKLTSITIPGSVTSIGEYAFYNCSGLASINIPDGVTSIGQAAFRNCSGLTSVNIPNGVTSIAQATFYGCSGLTSIYIPEGVTSIGDRAFYGCSGLTSVTIPEGVTSIGNYAFYNCSSLTSVVSKIQKPFAFGSNAFANISSNCVLTVPAGTRNAYISAGWTTSVFKGGIVEDGASEPGFSNNKQYLIHTRDKIRGSLGVTEKHLASTNPTAYGPWVCKPIVLDKDHPLITNVSQLSSPYTEPTEGSLNAMIDGNADTFWHSTWSNGDVENGQHYFQVEMLGQADIDVAFKVTRRKTDDNHITEWGIYGTNNANATKANCTKLAVIETPYNYWGETRVSDIFKTGGYKYLRFYINNTSTSRGFGHLAEFQLYPATIDEAYGNASPFAIIQKNGGYYLYSVLDKAFITPGNDGDENANPLLPNDNKMNIYKHDDHFVFDFIDTGYTINVNHNGVVINDYGTLTDKFDDGNLFTIEEVGDFDPTEALAMFDIQTFTVTYEVRYNSKVVATTTEKVASGSALPPVPATLDNDFVTLKKTGTHPTTVTKDVTVRYNATWKGPFEFTNTETSAKWYNMHIRSGWYVGKQDTEPYYPVQVDEATLATPAYQWAFGGDPYHVKVYNRTTGLAETLTKDGENAVMRPGDYTWDLLPNSDGFVLRVTGTKHSCINQIGGGNGPLLFWDDVNSPTDDGSTFRVEEATVIELPDYVINDETTSFNIEAEASGKTVEFTHAFNGEWEALYLPFAIDYDAIKADFDLAEIDGIVQNDDNNDGIADFTVLSIMGFREQMTTPNTPYLIRAKKSGMQTINFEDVTVYPTTIQSIDCSSTSTKYEFTGSYNTLNASALTERYIVQSGELVKGASSLAPCRWYMTATARKGRLNLPAKIRIMPVEDVITGVSLTPALSKGEGVWYDLSGCKLGSKPSKPGLYIQNGKKVLLK